MSVIEEMLNTYPRDLGAIDKEKLAACIAACLECSQPRFCKRTRL